LAVTLAVTVTGRSLVTMLVNSVTREDIMSVATATSPTRAPALPDRDTVEHADRGHEAKRSWVWSLVEALAYAGASIDPTAALAAQRFARIRDQELRRGRW
jgi:hypothetical protein